MNREKVKCYLRLYQPNGLTNPSATLPKDFEILDENTLMKKESRKKYTMHSYNKVFSGKISNQLMSRQIDIVDDLYEGINHTVLALNNKDTKKFFTEGCYEHQGMFLEYFLGIFYDCKNEYVKQTNKFYFSMFATVNNKPNHYIDLLTGQRYTYLSKKDIDGYKSFYEKKIIDLQDYLIALKIAAIRFDECCSQKTDFIVFRVGLESSQQQQNSKKSSKNLEKSTSGPQVGLKTFATGNLVVCQQENKYLPVFMKNLETLLKDGFEGQTKPTDHGGLYGCLEPYFKNGKLSIIQCLINDSKSLNDSIPDIEQVLKYMSLETNYKTCFIEMNPSDFKYNLLKRHAPKPSIPNLTAREVTKIKSFAKMYRNFLKDSKDKIEHMLEYYLRIEEIRSQFYQTQRFPVSLEIKRFEDSSFTVKGYFIAKIYSLSVKYQMEDIDPICEKLKILKNQLIIALKSIHNTVNKADQTEGKRRNVHSDESMLDLTVASPGRKEVPGKISQLTTKEKLFVQNFSEELSLMREKLKFLLRLEPRCLDNPSNREIFSKMKPEEVLSPEYLSSLQSALSCPINDSQNSTKRQNYVIRQLNCNLPTFENKSSVDKNSMAKPQQKSIEMLRNSNLLIHSDVAKVDHNSPMKCLNLVGLERKKQKNYILNKKSGKENASRHLLRLQQSQVLCEKQAFLPKIMVIKKDLENVRPKKMRCFA